MNTALSFVEILLHAIARGVTAFLRQSSRFQARHNRGSQLVQEENLDYVKAFGIEPAEVHVIRAYGESGDLDRQARVRYGELEARIRAGLVGVVVLARHDRLGRRSAHAASLFDAMAGAGVLLMVNGRIYDPADEGDAMLLNVYAELAEFENRARARWNSAARFAKARRLEERVVLPQGLLWVNVCDPQFEARARAAGLDAWVEAAAAHPARSRRGDALYQILPYPDADLVRACELRVQWMLETGRLLQVLGRIVEDPRWPHAGLVPRVQRPVPGRPDAPQRNVWRFTPDAEVVWEPATAHGLGRWLACPAVYGIYTYAAPSLASAGVKAKLRALKRATRAAATLAPPAARPQVAG